MNKKVSLYISSCTGNTRKIADALKEELQHENYEITIFNNKFENDIKNDDSIFIVCFWCRKSSLDFESLNVIDSLKGKEILAFGTMGSYPDSDYGKRVKQNVYAHIEKNNKCLGVFMSQGKVSLKSTERRRNLPKDNPHYLDEEGVKRHLDSQTHPDENDIKEAVLFLREKLEY